MLAAGGDRHVSRILRPVSGLLIAVLVPLVSVVGASSASGGAATAQRAVACSHHNGWFVPNRADLSHVGTGITVLAVRRKADGSMGAPPLTNTGKKQIGWDKPGIPPGYYKGSVPLDAHTWPDGSALGNKMLRTYHVGDTLILYGANHQKMCYRINQRTEYPRDQVPQQRIFRVTGPPQVAIVVCSGRRLGPGNWLKRTVWFGTPIR
jgi:hypothetical protein